jgi:hypothetical protein
MVWGECKSKVEIPQEKKMRSLVYRRHCRIIRGRERRENKTADSLMVVGNSPSKIVVIGSKVCANETFKKESKVSFEL